MKKNILYGVLALAVTVFAGCEDLDTAPEGNTTTPAQKEEVVKLDPKKTEAGVNAIFSQLSTYNPNEDALGASRDNDFGYPALMMFFDANGYDVVSDDNGYNWTGNSLDYSDRGTSSYESTIVWNTLYAQIKTSNAVVASLSADSEDPTINFLLAQALASRAFNYWVLAQLYQFNYVGNENAPCVPIVTEDNSDTAIEGVERATVAEVFTLITDDLDLAIKLLAKAQDGGVERADKRYVSLAVAYGLRARVNLTMQRWDEAAADASSAITEATSEGIKPATIAEVSKPYFNSVSENQWMWGVIISETDRVVTSGIVNWPSHMGSLNYGYANFSKGRQINKSLYEAIPATDVRKGWWLNDEGTSPILNTAEAAWMTKYAYPIYTHVKFAPYKGEVGTTTNANDIPLMRIEEMYLIKAEAEAMGGSPSTGAQTLVDFIKANRNPEYSFSGSSATDVQEEVYFHRRIELWGEGLSWFDIMRLNKAVDRRGGGYPNATMIFNIPAKDAVLLWRLPEKEILANPKLTNADNNPGAPTPLPVPDFE
jgi:hypothetical protein